MSGSKIQLRRIGSVSLYLTLFLLCSALASVILLATVLYDLVQRTSGSATRVFLLFWCYLGANLVALGAAFYLWLFHQRSPDYPRRNWRIQRHWTRFMWGAVKGLLRLDFRVEGLDQVAPGPMILFARHASMLDVLFPLWAASVQHKIYLRYVLKSELLFDPGMDIIGHRFPNHFVQRGSTDSAREIEAVGKLALGLAPDEAVSIFPEGTRFTPEKQARILSRLEERNPELHARAVRLQRLLPPRLGGPQALMEQGPDLDVVFLAHRGLEGFATMADLMSGGVVGQSVLIRCWRVPASEIPRERSARIAWLLDQWELVDRVARGD